MADILFMVSQLEKVSETNAIAKSILIAHWNQDYQPWRRKILYGGEADRLDRTLWNFWHQPAGKKHGYGREQPTDEMLRKAACDTEEGDAALTTVDKACGIITKFRCKRALKPYDGYWERKAAKLSPADLQKLRKYRHKKLQSLENAQIAELLLTETKTTFSIPAVKKMKRELHLSCSRKVMPPYCGEADGKSYLFPEPH